MLTLGIENKRLIVIIECIVVTTRDVRWPAHHIHQLDSKTSTVIALQTDAQIRLQKMIFDIKVVH